MCTAQTSLELMILLLSCEMMRMCRRGLQAVLCCVVLWSQALTQFNLVLNLVLLPPPPTC